MKEGHRTPAEETIAAKLPAELAEQIKQAAREDDRTVSAWLRRHFADVFRRSPSGEHSSGQESERR